MKSDEENATLQNEPEAPATERAKSKKGFASMDPTRRAEIASRGGKAAHAAGTAHKFNSEEGKLAGLKGGNAPHVSRGRQVPKATGQ